MHPKSGRSKFLFVIDNLSTGGAQRQMVNLALGLTHRGYQIEIFCYAPGDLLANPLVEAGIQIHWHFKRKRYSPDVVLNLRELIQKEHYDLVLSFLPGPNLYSIIANRLLGSHHVPVVVSERSCDHSSGVYRASRINRLFYPFAAHVVVNSHHQRINLARKYPFIKDRLTTIYNGYDLNSFSPALSEPNNHPIKILSIASVSPFKNGLCLLEALHILNLNYKSFPLVTWIGERVNYGDRLEYLNLMENAIKNYNLDKQWQWLDQRSDIISQLHHHDVLVHSSYVEGLPNVVCEALACARPVIVSNTLDHPKLVQDEYSGYLFDWQNPNDLAEKIIRFSNLTLENRMRMGRNGRLFAEKNLSIGRFLDEYENLFLSIVRR